MTRAILTAITLGLVLAGLAALDHTHAALMGDWDEYPDWSTDDQID